MNKKLYVFFKVVILSLSISFLLYLLISLSFINSSISQIQKSAILSKANSAKNIYYNYKSDNLEQLNFTLSNDRVIELISTKNSIDLIRYTTQVNKTYNFDGAMIVSKDGEILAKSDFIKISSIAQAANIVSDVFKGQTISTMLKLKKDDLDEGLKFKYNQKSAQLVSNKSHSVIAEIKGIPIFDNRTNLVAIYMGVRILNGDTEFLSRFSKITPFKSIGIYTNNNLISSSITKKEQVELFEKEIKHSPKKIDLANYYINYSKKLIFLPINDYSKKQIGYLVFKLNNDKTSLTNYFIIFSIVMILVLLVAVIFLFKWYKNSISLPIEKIDEIIDEMYKGNFKLPLLENKYKVSQFYETLMKLYKISAKISKIG